MITAGRHHATVAKTFLATSTAGNDQIGVTFRIADGSTITRYLSCTEKAWPYTEENLRSIGWDAEQNGFAFEALNEDPSPVVGNECSIVIREETYNGKTRLAVQFINPATAAALPGNDAVEIGRASCRERV